MGSLQDCTFCYGNFYDKNYKVMARISADGRSIISADGYQIGSIKGNKLYDSCQNYLGYFTNNCLYDIGGGIKGPYISKAASKHKAASKDKSLTRWDVSQIIVDNIILGELILLTCKGLQFFFV